MNSLRPSIFKDKNEEGDIPIMPRGDHKLAFDFQLPESNLPCSFESKIGTIRYYLRVIIDIPYASPPQGLKYFTIIGPHIDCMEDRYLVSMRCRQPGSACMATVARLFALQTKTIFYLLIHCLSKKTTHIIITMC